MAKRTHCDRCDKVVEGASALTIEIPTKLLGLEDRGTIVRFQLTARITYEAERVHKDDPPLELCPFCQGEILDVVSEQIGEPFIDRMNIHGSRRF